MANIDDGPERQRAATRLSAGERECLEFVAQHLGSKEIARKLHISPHTVDARLKSACAKLGTKSRFVAAQMLTANVTVTTADTNLVYGSPDLSNFVGNSEDTASAGEGDDPDGRASGGLLHQGDWRGGNNLLAKFARKQKNLSVFRQTVLIICIAMVALFAFGALVNGMVGLSKVLSSP